MGCKTNPCSGSWVLGLGYGSVYFHDEKHKASGLEVHEETHAGLGRHTMSVGLQHTQELIVSDDSELCSKAVEYKFLEISSCLKPPNMLPLGVQ